MEPRKLRAPLLRWFRLHRRDLPWRNTDDPYAVWVAEIMLQQTRVATVVPYYNRFIERFPDARAVARASEDEVLSLWSGLGYYRRARFLRAACREVVERYDGRVPDDPRRLVELPGVGRYTAGAIASVAFGRAEPVLDGNVRRVLSRVFAIDAGRVGRGQELRTLWELARELVRGPRPGDLNQALMELGATVCRPRGPACADCPLARHCSAHRTGTVESYPAPAPAPKIRTVEVVAALVHRGGRVLLERPGAGNPLRGTWDLPAREVEAKAQRPATIRLRFEREHGLEIAVGARLGTASHGIMNRRLRIDLFRCSLRRGRVSARRELCWVAPSRLSEVPVSGATRKLLRLAGEID